MTHPIARQRLHNQYITRTRRGSAADVVAWFGAVQAQEYGPARWALALRMRTGVADETIRQAVDEGTILRTHAMRPTWHFVTPADIQWILQLTAPRVRQAMASYNRLLELDAKTCARACRIFERSLRDRQYLTRVELGARLARAGIVVTGTRLGMLAMDAEIGGVICSGPYRGKKPTYALLAERAPASARMARDEALAELARRYFRGHGPATIRDFVWWSGLLTADAKRGLEMNRATPRVVDGVTYWTIGDTPATATPGSRVHLLPIYDEYVVAYRDRDVVPFAAARSLPARPPDAVTFQHALVVDGQVAGTWRVVPKTSGVTVPVIPLRRLTAAERRGLLEAALRYERFLGTPVTLSVSD